MARLFFGMGQWRSSSIAFLLNGDSDSIFGLALVCSRKGCLVRCFEVRQGVFSGEGLWRDRGVEWGLYWVFLLYYDNCRESTVTYDVGPVKDRSMMCWLFLVLKSQLSVSGSGQMLQIRYPCANHSRTSSSFSVKRIEGFAVISTLK